MRKTMEQAGMTTEEVSAARQTIIGMKQIDQQETMYIPPLASTGPSEWVTVAAPATTTPIAPYVAIAQDQPTKRPFKVEPSSVQRKS